ncbi:hypothetical protein L9F63_008856, partial [Diploptera punctata]
NSARGSLDRFFFAEKTVRGTTYLDMLEHKMVLLPTDKVYTTPVKDLRDLRERIIEAIENIPEDILQRTWQEIVHRFDIVTVTAGAHIEMCFYLQPFAKGGTDILECSVLQKASRFSLQFKASVSRRQGNVASHMEIHLPLEDLPSHLHCKSQDHFTPT